MVSTHTCLDGKIFDYVSRKFVPCPECGDTRKHDIYQGVSSETGENIADILNLPADFSKIGLERELLISPSQRDLLTVESCSRYIDGVETVYNRIRSGQKLECSYCFGIDRVSPVLETVRPLLLAAYRQSESVSPFTSTLDYCDQLRSQEEAIRSGKYVESFMGTYLNSSIMVMLIPSGTSEFSVLEAKGLMQARAAKGLPSIFITSRPAVYVRELLLGANDEPSYYSCVGAFVEYRSRDDLPAIVNTTGVSQTPTFSLSELRN